MSLYDSDLYAWSQQQAAAIRSGHWEAIDREHLAEEVEDWWKTDSLRRRQLLEDLCLWLLAYTYAPDQRLAHTYWYVWITVRRIDVGVITRAWSNLAARSDADLEQAYALSREPAAEETGLPVETFPETCPWTFDQVLEAPLEGRFSPFGPTPPA